MPIINVRFSEKQEKEKSKFIAEVTEITAQCLELPKEKIRVYLDEYQENCNRTENSIYFDIKVIANKPYERKKQLVSELMRLAKKYFNILIEDSAASFTLLKEEDCFLGEYSIYEIRNKK